MKKIIATSLFVLLVLVNLNVLADNENSEIFNVQGKVIDKNTGEALAGVTINISGEEIYTDFEGNFVLKASSNSTMEVSFISYKAVKIDIANLEKGEYLNIELEN